MKKALGAEKDPQVERDFLRALASCGRADSSSRKKVLAELKSKDATMRLNATFGLGWHAAEADAAEILRATCASGVAQEVQAALLGLALASQGAFSTLAEAVAQNAAADAETREVASRVVAVLGTDSPLSAIGDDVARVCGDSVRRERFFPATATTDGEQKN